MLELKEPCIQDQQWVNALLEQANQKQTLFSCDLPFGSTFIWRGMYHIRIGRYKQFYLRAYGNEPGKIRFAYPIGDGDIQEVLAQMLLYAKQVHKELALVGLTAQQTQQVEALYPGEFVFASNRAYAEYIYYSQDLAELRVGNIMGNAIIFPVLKTCTPIRLNRSQKQIKKMHCTWPSSGAVKMCLAVIMGFRMRFARSVKRLSIMIRLDSGAL